MHYSTDYVFDGSGARPWVESDPTEPLNVYGRTKRDGELAIQQSGCRHLIFRTSWVYSAKGKNFAKTMLKLAAERDRLTVIADQFGAPTGAELLAAGKSRGNKLIVEYIDARDESGAYHYFTACMAAGEIIFMGHARSSHWVVKALGNAPDRQAALRPYLLAHGPMLKRVFQLARIDYALVDGKIQVFEINTNPTIGTAEYLLKIARLLDAPPTEARIPSPPPRRGKRGEPARLGRSFRLSRRLHLFLRQAGLLHCEPAVLRAAYFFSRWLKSARRLMVDRLRPRG